jgi:hypothetical protein
LRGVSKDGRTVAPLSSFETRARGALLRMRTVGCSESLAVLRRTRRGTLTKRLALAERAVPAAAFFL